jgi:hypothetical protein
MSWVDSLLIVVGVALLGLAAAQGAEAQAAPAARQEIVQYGITWRFDRPVRSGQFITGDWWVVGPVTVVGITPAPGPASGEAAAEFRKNRWGDTSLRNDDRMRNGSAVVLQCSGGQGYDSRSDSYDPKLSLSLPYTLEPNRSLVSTISNPTLPVANFVQALMWQSEKQCENVLNTAAVLTCLAAEPPADAFRPPYGGTEKPIYRASDLEWDLLLHLEPAGNVPPWEDFERYFQRPWLDDLMSWTQQQVNPNENQTNYGREASRVISIASLMVHLNVPRERKGKLVIGLVQRGIDLSGLAKIGGYWNEGGGHSSGRKWPILFASLMLGKPELRDLPETAVFQEDTQTYYGKGWFGQTALWQMITHHGPRQPYEEKPPEQWERWDRTSEGYRLCCTAVSWTGTALAARLMKAIPIWKHDAFFDYCDRWMRPDDPYEAARGDHRRPRMETTSFDPFVDAMWRAYRDTAPAQPYSEHNLKWVWEGDQGTWVENPRPEGRP